MASNDPMVNMMNGDDDPTLKNNIFLRWLSRKLNPNSASAADTSDLDNPMVGAGSDGGNAGYGEGSHERDNEGADANRVTAATTVPSMFAFAAKPASPDMANDQPKPASQPVALERAGHVPRSQQDDEQRKAGVQFRPGAMPGVVLEGDEDVPLYEKQANQYGPVETSDTNSKSSASVPPLFLSAAAAASKPSNPADTANEIAAGAEDETGNDLPVLAPQGSKNALLRGLQKLFGVVGDTPQPGQKYSPGSSMAHRVGMDILGRVANAGAAIGFDTDPRALMLKKQEIALELARLNEELEYHKELYGDRDARTQLLAQRLQDMQNYHNGLLDKLSQKTVQKFNPDTNQVELYGWSDKDQDYTHPLGLAAHQPTEKQSMPSRPFQLGNMMYRYPTSAEQAKGITDPVLLGPAKPVNGGKRSAAGSVDQLKPTKGPNGNIISVYDPATKTNWFPQDINDPNMPFYVQKFLTNAAANKKEDKSSSKKVYTPKF